jgi:thiol:disulfide interchange protein DsbC
MIMFRRIILALLPLCLFLNPALGEESAQARQAASVKHAIESRFPGTEVQHVAKGPMDGLYEVVLDGRLVYSDAQANYLFVGSIIDAKTQRNITRDRAHELFKVKFDSLPLDKAIKVVKGNGKRQMAVFSDPDCPFCKRLEKTMESINDVTMYVFLYPIESLHPDATKKAAAVWCSDDRAKAWQDLMLKGVRPKSGDTCTNPVADIVKLGQRLGVTGTPTIIFSDGHVAPGALPAKELNRLLDAGMEAKNQEAKK